MIDNEEKLRSAVTKVIEALPASDLGDVMAVLGATTSWAFSLVSDAGDREQVVEGYCRMLRGEAPPARGPFW